METLKLVFSSLCWLGLFFQLSLVLFYTWAVYYIGEEEFAKLYEDAVYKNRDRKEITWKTNLGRRIFLFLLTTVTLYFLDFFSYSNLNYNILWGISNIFLFTAFPYNNEKNIFNPREVITLSVSIFLLRFLSYVGTGLVWFFGI